MKTILSVILMMISLLMGFQQAIIVIQFGHHQDFIEQNFCVNKDRPELQCHGICFLKKQLQETDHSDPDTIRMYKTVDLFHAAVATSLTGNMTMDIFPGLSRYQESDYMEPYKEIFVPPPIMCLYQ